MQFGAGLPVVFPYSICEFLENPCAECLTFLKGVNVMLLWSLNIIRFGSLSVREVPTNSSRTISSVIELGREESHVLVRCFDEFLAVLHTLILRIS